ncbi:MAG TPA: hypothetical protein VGS13_16175 [Stellaceae bacterium]|nr:hypothetical protein [Stellaceae bacterium]
MSVTGCVEQVDTAKQAEALAQLHAGRAILGCHEPCLAGWRDAQPRAAQLDAGARWQDLALLVMRTDYQDDLSLYYLGRAAEGTGYPGAAAIYYRQSTRLSGTAAACQKLSGLCGGVSLPRAAALRAASVERELVRARLRRTGPPRGAATPGAAAEDVEATTPTPLASPASPAASEYIEPPPAPR